jgi:hypothetical protein
MKTPVEPMPPKSKLSPAIDTIIERWQQGDHNATLTVGGHRFEIQDDASFQMLIDLLDRLDNIAAIQIGLDDIKAGRLSSFEDVKKRLREKYGLSD